MKKLLFAAALVALILLVVWRHRETPRPVSSSVAERESVSPSAPSAPSTSAPPLAPASTPPPSVSTASPASPVFGDHRPVLLTDLPAGRLREQIAALPPAARAHAFANLARHRVPLADVASVHTDATGELFYACDLGPHGDATDPENAVGDGTTGRRAGTDVLPEFAVSVPVITPPVRHSRPGSTNVIYLDFNGHTVTGTVWNTGSGAAAAYVCVPYDSDGNTGSFSPEEQSSIVRIWQRVAEDYRAFDVDVTTEEPATYTNRTAHVVITRNKDANGIDNPSSTTAGGIAYLNVFGQSNYAATYAISFVYASGSSAENWIAGTISHESGHNMGLHHDGTVDASGNKLDEYYAGHGSGPTSWSPIMGSGSGVIQQWSKGEYYRSNNTEDDLAMIAAKLSYRADDHAATDGFATPLVINGAEVWQRGVISNSADADRFSFTTGAGAVSLTVTANTFPLIVNKGCLDLAALLYDSSGNLVVGSDPAEGTAAMLSATVAAGTYYIRVYPAGTGSPLTSPPTGYTVYGSIGEYVISGTVVPTATTASATVAQQPDSATVFPGNSATFSVIARGSPAVTYQWQRSTDSGSTWPALANDATFSGATSAALTVSAVTETMSGHRFRCVVTNTSGSAASNAATLTVQTPPPPVLPAFFGTGIPVPSFSRGLPAGTSQNLNISLAAGSDPITLQWRLNGTDIPGANGLYYFVRNWREADAGVYTVTATNSLGTVVSAPYTQYISPEGGWRWRNPLVTGNGLTRAAFLNGRFFIGGLRGTLLVSTDGLNWETRTVPCSNNIYGFHYLNGLYVALASLGAVFTSPDTIIWTPRNTGTLHQDSSSGLQFVASSGTRLLAVGINGVTTTSTDGINWTPGSTQTGDDLNGVTYGLGKFYAVSATNGRIYITADGATWASVASSASSLRAITFGAGRLVAVGASGVISTSTDGSTWTSATSGTGNSLLGIEYVNSRFIATGLNGTILTSTNGTTWSFASSGGNLSNLQNTAYGAGVYIIPGQSGTSGRALLSSTDGASWSEQIAGAGAVTRNLRGLAAANNSLVAVGTTGTILESNSDGSTWTQRTSGTSAQLNDVVFGGSRFIAVGNSGAITTVIAGLTNWSGSTVGSANFNGIAFGSSLWVAVGSSGVIRTSSTGTSWSAATSGTTVSLNKVTHNGTLFVAVGDSGTIRTSANGTAWSAATSPTTLALNDVTSGGGLFVAVGNGVVLTSADGTTWTDRTFTPDNLTSVIYASGYFIATGPGSTYYVSADGVSWTGRFTGNFDPVYDLAAFAGQIFAVGDNSTILSAGAPTLATSATLTAALGNPVTLAAAVSASPFPVIYQWQRNGVNITGANRPTLTLATPALADSGTYTLVATNALGTVTSSATTLTLTPDAWLSNLSVRAATDAAKTLIVGFVVEGSAKPILVRAAGPALNDYGLTGVTDPLLRLYNGATLVTSNDDWPSALATTFASLGAFPFTTASKDAALLQTLTGPHTAQATSTNSGQVLVEAYDVGPNDGRKLTNLSARFQVGTGDNILIAGFVLAGSGTRQLLVRAVGPKLADYGVTGVLADPRLTVFDAGTPVASNDNWDSSLAPTFTTVGAFALTGDTKSAALVVALQAGKPYTVQVSGIANTTGEALVELYLVP